MLDSYSGTEALMVLERKQVDLILLDLMLPGLTGEEIVSKIKHMPIIVISAKISPEDKVHILLSGANDYITKPFDANELLARVKVQLRVNGNSQKNTLHYKDMALDSMTHTLKIKNQKINLTKTEYAILKLLMQNPNQVISKTVILERIFEDTPDCTDRSLKQHISNLRKKLRDTGDKEYIEAVWGIGFKITF